MPCAKAKLRLAAPKPPSPTSSRQRWRLFRQAAALKSSLAPQCAESIGLARGVNLIDG